MKTSCAVQPIFFRSVGNAVMDNSITFGDAGFGPMFVNNGSAQLFFAGDPELQVNGRIQIQNWADSTAPEYRTACATDFGVVEVCDNQPSSGGSGGSGGRG